MKADSSSAVSDTSMTCFLLDLSLEAQSTEPPRRSTVNSGFDWLLPNFWNQGNSMRRHLWHKDDVTGTGCGFRRIFMIKNKKSEEVINVKMLENCSGYETKSTTLLLWILFCSSLCTHTSLVWCYQKSRNTVSCYLYHVHINEHTVRLVWNLKFKSLNSFQALFTSLTLCFRGCSWIVNIAINIDKSLQP